MLRNALSLYIMRQCLRNESLGTRLGKRGDSNTVLPQRRRNVFKIGGAYIVKLLATIFIANHVLNSPGSRNLLWGRGRFYQRGGNVCEAV